jgi:hypothetical protein
MHAAHKDVIERALPAGSRAAAVVCKQPSDHVQHVQKGTLVVCFVGRHRVLPKSVC